MRVSSFKPQHRQAPPRSATPPRPVWEPLSPIIRPHQAPTANPAGGSIIDLTLNSNGLASVSQHIPHQNTHPRAQLQRDTAVSTYETSPRSAPLPPRGDAYSPALGSPIETLADVAMSSLHASPTYVDSARRSAQLPASPTAFAHPPGHRAPKHAYALDGNYPYSERPAKRVRSDYFSPQHGQQYSRPATSHIPNWSYNVEQMVDNGHRMYQDAAPPVQYSDENSLKRLSDAQLLMDFAVAASSSTPRRASTIKRWSVSHQEALNPHTQQLQVEPGNLYLGASLVSPRSHHHVQPADTKHTLAVLPTASEAQPDKVSTQTETPPDDFISTKAPSIVNELNATADPKPKKQQGWPKGKPRGPRNSAPVAKKKRSNAKSKPASSTTVPDSAKQLQSPQSLPAEQHDAPIAEAPTASAPFPPSHEPEPQARRYSFADATRISSFQNLSRPFARASSVPLGSGTFTAPHYIVPPSENLVEPVTICASCGSSDSETMIGDGEQWIRCDGCKEWHHYGCAGFQSEREVRDVDKFYCERCRPNYGETTKVRKSTRAHTAVDYAGLNEGILKTSDDNPEHHYIAAFKNGDIEFTPETFARLPPELVSADFLEKTNGFKEPILIPAALNPRPNYPGRGYPDEDSTTIKTDANAETSCTFEMVPDDGQDKLDMVIPEGLTVRRVSELYGPQERVPVIDVKAQEGEDKRWTMAKWADYYEQQGEKPVRNVISLEVSRSRLGRLIRRPKAVRDMDLQDAVWRDDDKKAPPAVQFYCLMSVADCYTDFHIDFGGSSVYYHIVKGKKVFFFIPPTKQNLKKYEDWCLSPKQGHEWLGHQVKECYRVDLYPGDTMLIPSGWIHAVWTPEDSLVIGGNFLTRLHYGMQIKVLEIEKNTKVAMKFRYPFFQKLMWLALIRYLEEDPLPPQVEQLLLSGGQFQRDVPPYCETDKFGHNSRLGPDNYHRRYYPKAELEGLSDLGNYVWRTVLISLGRIEGISDKIRKSVTSSIPKGFGEPLVLAKRFAAWIAWKRGNEYLPQWAHSDAVLPDAAEVNSEKKLSAAEVKRMEKHAMGEGLRANSERQSARTRTSDTTCTNGVGSQSPVLVTPPPPPPPLPMFTGFLQKTDPSRPQTTPKTSQLGPKRIACDACRKRRIRCKHKDEIFDPTKPAGLVGGLHTIDLSGSLGLSVKRRYSDFGASGQQASPADKNLSNGGPLLADANGDPYALKSGRVKACADCRKSKRRCIHDEYGNVDPVKANEIPIPRGAAAKKRRISEEDPTIIQRKPNKAATIGNTAHTPLHHRNSSSGEFGVGSTAELQDLAFSAQQALDQVPDDDAMPIDPALQSYNHENDLSIMDTSPQALHRDAVMFSVENLPNEILEGVEEASLNMRPGLSMESLSPGAGTNGFHGAANDFAGSHTSSHANLNGVLFPPQTPNGQRSTFAGSSGRKTSQTPYFSNRKSNTPKTPSSRRRDSKESIKLEPRSEPKVRAASSAFTNNEEDTASLALALQLQMEEHGLRRRSMI
ncbi:JmjC domain-containing histone demethylation protein 1 [Kalmusia sp. IMI 367209]|nr:JmjC domain-containing histone demethylation protein 1 [Kalmusia sp. IMI 367209]